MSRVLFSKERLSYWVLLLIVLIGAWLRVGVTLKTQVDTPIRADALDYYSYSYNMRELGVYSRESSWLSHDKVSRAVAPDALRSPGYPLFLLAFVDAEPEERTVFRITLMQALLGIFVIPLTFISARKFLSSGWALMPSLLVAISPQLVNCGVYILTESLFVFLLMAAVACFSASTERIREYWPIITGIILGMASITRPTLNYIVPFLFVALFPLLPRGIRWSWFVKLLLGFAVFTLPWLLRNFIVLGGGDSTLTINTLLHGHYPWAMFNADPRSFGMPYRFDPDAERLSSSIAVALSGIWGRIKDDPYYYLLWYMLGKPIMFFSWSDAAASVGIFTYPTPISPYRDNVVFLASMYLMQKTHFIWIALASVSMLASLFYWKSDVLKDGALLSQRFIVALCLYFLVVHSIGFPISRYSVPILPLIYILATLSLFYIYKCASRCEHGNEFEISNS